MAQAAQLNKRFSPKQQKEAVALAYVIWKRRQEKKRLIRLRGKLKPYYYDFHKFIHECVDWGESHPTHYQDAIAIALVQHKRVAEKGPHGIGKSTIAALAVIWFALTSEEMGVDWKIITTASSWTQLKRYLWPEIHKWFGKIKWDKVGRDPLASGRELLDLTIKFGNNQAFAVASKNYAFIEGAHAKRLLYVFDEAKEIPDATFDAAEGAFANVGTRGYEAYALVLSTPGDEDGRFYQICSRAKGYEDWHVIPLTVDDALKAGTMTPEFVEQRRRQWGEESQLFQNRILGNFYASNNAQKVIPLSWVEAANRRWQEWTNDGKTHWKHLGRFRKIGVDVAWEGDDKSVIACRFDRGIWKLTEYQQQNPTEIAARAEIVLNTLGGDTAVIDTIGIGAGVYSALLTEGEKRRTEGKNGYKVEAFVASESSSNMDATQTIGFANKRAAAWWYLRELLDPQNHPTLCLPPHPELVGDLTAPTYKPLAGAKYLIESKADIKKRRGKSTDYGDAVVMALFEEMDQVIKARVL